MNPPLFDTLVSQIKSSIHNNQFEILVKVKGSWLLKNDLAETWKQLRNTPDQVINDEFIDYLTLSQAQALGLIKEV